jgi:hypothetical protein
MFSGWSPGTSSIGVGLFRYSDHIYNFQGLGDKFQFWQNSRHLEFV